MGRLLLVRHGQASWGSADYDVLSETGAEQSRALGRWLAGRGVAPGLVVRGRMRRHRETFDALSEGAGWDADVTEDLGWDEFDHVALLAGHPTPWADGHSPSPAEFQDWFDEAITGWIEARSGAGHESFSDFTERVDAALRRTTERLDALGPGAVGVGVTSGGPISWVVASLVGAPPESWRRLNRVAVNAAVTTVVTGQRGASLVTYNEHSFLPGDLLTYR